MEKQDQVVEIFEGFEKHFNGYNPYEEGPVAWNLLVQEMNQVATQTAEIVNLSRYRAPHGEEQWSEKESQCSISACGSVTYSRWDHNERTSLRSWHA